jgi:hypothetical protein
MQYTEQELNKLIEDVEKEFTAHLAKAEQSVESLAPTTEAQEQSLEKAEEKKEEKPVEEKKDEEKKDEEKKDEEKKEEKPAEEKKEEDHGYDEKDIDEMHKMYESMSKGELTIHHSSIQKAMEKCGLAKCGEITPMKKSEEIDAPKPDASPELDLLKAEVSKHQAKSEELQKSLDMVTDFLAKLVEKKVPQSKAITSLEVLAKSEQSEEKELTKSEITQILTKKASDPSLSKEDREAINAFYLNGANINSISHLLKQSV